MFRTPSLPFNYKRFEVVNLFKFTSRLILKIGKYLISKVQEKNNSLKFEAYRVSAPIITIFDSGIKLKSLILIYRLTNND